MQLKIILDGLLVGILAVVYSIVLTGPRQLLRPWRDYLYAHLMKWSCFNEQTGFSKDYPNPDNHFKDHSSLWRPLMGCEICVAGQLSLWGFTAYYFTSYKQAVVNIVSRLSFACVDGLLLIAAHHLLTIACSILWASIIKKIYQWTQY